jgi:hypothetical protein
LPLPRPTWHGRRPTHSRTAAANSLDALNGEKLVGAIAERDTAEARRLATLLGTRPTPATGMEAVRALDVRDVADSD